MVPQLPDSRRPSLQESYSGSKLRKRKEVSEDDPTLVEFLAGWKPDWLPATKDALSNGSVSGDTLNDNKAVFARYSASLVPATLPPSLDDSPGSRHNSSVSLNINSSSIHGKKKLEKILEVTPNSYDSIEKRCQGTTGKWCQKFLLQQPVPSRVKA